MSHPDTARRHTARCLRLLRRAQRTTSPFEAELHLDTARRQLCRRAVLMRPSVARAFSKATQRAEALAAY